MKEAIIVIVGIVIFYIVAKFLIKKLSKILIFLLAVLAIFGGLYFLNIWPFDKSLNIDHLQATYCSDVESNKCECIVQPIINDLERKHGKEVLDSINQDKIKISIEIAKSFKNILPEIKTCLAQKKAEDELNDFIVESFSIDIKEEDFENLKNKLNSLIGE